MKIEHACDQTATLICETELRTTSIPKTLLKFASFRQHSLGSHDTCMTPWFIRANLAAWTPLPPPSATQSGLKLSENCYSDKERQTRSYCSGLPVKGDTIIGLIHSGKAFRDIRPTCTPFSDRREECHTPTFSSGFWIKSTRQTLRTARSKCGQRLLWYRYREHDSWKLVQHGFTVHQIKEGQ